MVDHRIDASSGHHFLLLPLIFKIKKPALRSGLDDLKFFTSWLPA